MLCPAPAQIHAAKELLSNWKDGATIHADEATMQQQSSVALAVAMANKTLVLGVRRVTAHYAKEQIGTLDQIFSELQSAGRAMGWDKDNEAAFEYALSPAIVTTCMGDRAAGQGVFNRSIIERKAAFENWEELLRDLPGPEKEKAEFLKVCDAYTCVVHKGCNLEGAFDVALQADSAAAGRIGTVTQDEEEEASTDEITIPHAITKLRVEGVDDFGGEIFQCVWAGFERGDSRHDEWVDEEDLLGSQQLKHGDEARKGNGVEARKGKPHTEMPPGKQLVYEVLLCEWAKGRHGRAEVQFVACPSK